MTSSQLTRRTYAYVRITGRGRHEDITSILGMQPTEAWNVDDINSRHGRPRKFMAWEFRSGLDDTHELEEHIRALLLWFDVKAEDLRRLWVDYDITLQCVGYFPASCGSGVHFDREVVRRAAALGMAIDLDHYFLEDFGHGV
jgi:hypothetical protein